MLGIVFFSLFLFSFLLISIFIILEEIGIKIFETDSSEQIAEFNIVLSAIVSMIITVSLSYVTVTKTDLSNNIFVSHDTKFEHKQIQSIVTEVYENEEMYKEFRDKFIAAIDLDNIKKYDNYIIRISNHFVINSYDENILLKMFPDTEGAKQIEIFKNSKKRNEI